MDLSAPTSPTSNHAAWVGSSPANPAHAALSTVVIRIRRQVTVASVLSLLFLPGCAAGPPEPVATSGDTALCLYIDQLLPGERLPDATLFRALTLAASDEHLVGMSSLVVLPPGEHLLNNLKARCRELGVVLSR